MLITKIELQNFMCYAGYNSFDFTEGLNIIIGDNGYGKSKLFDAFYWVLYDECFETNKKKFVKTNLLRSSIVSDKAKHECEEDEKVTTYVKLTFYNPDRDIYYILERKYTVTKLEDEWREGQFSDFTLWKKDGSYLNANIVTNEDEKDRIKQGILPDNIKPYMWFQGEQVESIIDFNNQDTLTQAINVLSNITRYDIIEEVAAAAYKTAKNEYSRETRRLSVDTDKSEELERKRKQTEDIVQHLLKEEVETRNNLALAEEKFEMLLNNMNDAQKVKDLEEKKRSKKADLQDKKLEQLNEQISFHKKMFKNKWVLKGAEFLYEAFSEKFSEYEQIRLQKEADIKAKIKAENDIIQALNTRLPIDVPEPIYVQQMLKAERCLVCDREAKMGSDAWKKIKELIERPKAKSKSKDTEPISKHNFQREFKTLYQNGLGLSHNIKNIDEDINETLYNMQQTNKKVRDLTKDYEQIESEAQRVLNDTTLKVEEAEDILNEIAINDHYKEKYRDELASIKYSIAQGKGTLEDLEKQLKELVTGDIPKKLIEKVQVLEDFSAVATSTRKRVFDELIARLESEANIHYESMTKGNKSVRGRIKLKKLANGNYMPELINSDGKPLLQLNTGNIILIKLATIMAIISARQGSRTTDLYTLITDAPMSVFGEDYTIGFCKTVSQVYKQSIIMSKEFYKNEKLRKELLTSKDIRLGKVYIISPSINETDRSNRNKLATKLKELV